MLNSPRVRAAAAGAVAPAARALVRLGVAPNTVSVVGGVGTAAAAALTLPTGRFLAAFLSLTVLSGADLLDGAMARLSGRTSSWGAFLDSTVDRISDGVVLGGIALFYAWTGDPWLVGLAVAALLVGQVTSYVKARAESLGAAADVGIAERAERVLLILLALLLTGLGLTWAMPVALLLLVVLGVATVGQRISAVRAQLRGGGS